MPPRAKVEKVLPEFPPARSSYTVNAGWHGGARDEPPMRGQIPIPEGKPGCLQGITFVVTGTMPSITKEELKELIEKYGGRVTGSISGKTDVLVRGCADVGPKKIQDAESKGIIICDQEGLFEVIQRSLGEAPKPKPVEPPTQFVYDAEKPLDGIIAHLTRECGGNVHEKGVVKVTASPNSESAPEKVVDLKLTQSELAFHLPALPDSWICYDFEGRSVTPTSYSILTSDDGGIAPKSWVLEVSNDGSDGSWQVVDSREDNDMLDGCRQPRNFAVTPPPSGAFRFVRFRQTGESPQDCPISALELFGQITK